MKLEAFAQLNSPQYAGFEIWHDENDTEHDVAVWMVGSIGPDKSAHFDVYGGDPRDPDKRNLICTFKISALAVKEGSATKHEPTP